jgi:hypothetical protein
MVTSQLAMDGLNLTSPSWSLSALTAAVAGALNVSSGAVNVAVTSYAVTVTLQLAAAPASQSSAAGAISALFAAAAGVDPSSVSVTAAVSQSGGRRHVLQSSPTTLLVHIGGLPAANPGAVASLQQQLASPGMQVAASAALQVPVTSSSAAVEAVLSVTVSTSTLALAQAVASMLAAGSQAQIAAALQAAGVPVSGVTALSSPQVGYMPPPAGNIPASVVPPAAMRPPPSLALPPHAGVPLVPPPPVKVMPVMPRGVSEAGIVAIVVSVSGALLLAACLVCLRARRKRLRVGMVDTKQKRDAKSSDNTTAVEDGLPPPDPALAAFLAGYTTWRQLDFAIHANFATRSPEATANPPATATASPADSGSDASGFDTGGEAVGERIILCGHDVWMYPQDGEGLPRIEEELAEEEC